MRSMALALPQPATTNDGTSRNLLDAWDKLHRIAVRIDDEFHKVVQNQAQQIATSDPATFDIVAFVTGWKQQFEGYRTSAEAVSTFGAELDNVIGGYAGYGSAEFVQAAKQKRDELQTLLDKRNQADAVIEEQIKALDTLIGYPAGTQAGTQPAAQQALIQIAQKATKRAAKKAAKLAAPPAAKQPGKQPAKKAAKQAAKKAGKQAAKKAGKQATKKATKKAGKRAAATP